MCRNIWRRWMRRLQDGSGRFKKGENDAAADQSKSFFLDRYLFVKAEFFALGHQIHVYDKSGREVGMVKQRLLTLLPAFDIEIDGKEFGSVQKEFTFFKPRYELDYNGWRCEGDFLAWDYDVYEECCAVVHISKKPFHWGDTYVIDILDPKDEIMALMLAIAIDAANCTNK